MSRYYSSILNVLSPSFTNKYSIALDGVEDYVVSVPTLMGAYNTAIIRSFSFWVKINSGTYVPFFCGKGGGAAPSPRYSCGSGIVLGRLQWALDYYRASSAYCRAYSELIDGTGDPTKNILDGNWHHIAIYNPVDSTTNRANIVNCKMWLDGQPLTVLNDGAPYGTNAVRGLGSALQIGVGSTGSYSGQDYLNGNIDEFSYFDNYELTNDDVTAIYNSGTPTNLSDLTTPPTNWYRNGDNGTWKSPQWLIPSNENKDKVSNYSFDFDGVDDLFTYPEIAFLKGGGSYFSISMWVKVDTTTQRGFWCCRSATPDNIDFIINTSGELILSLKSSVSGDIVATSTSAISNNTWTHIGATFDGTEATASDRIKLYVNGSIFASSSTGTGANLPNGSLTNINYIGSSWQGIKMLGSIDEMAIFNSALTGANMISIYNSGTPTTLPSGVVAHWEMGENSTFVGGVWTVEDVVGSNDGTSANMTIEDRIGDAPNSTSNALSLNMDEVDRETDVPT